MVSASDVIEGCLSQPLEEIGRTPFLGGAFTENGADVIIAKCDSIVVARIW